jgi:hypothetical protein
MTHFFRLALFFSSFFLTAQESKIDTLSFEVNRSLLVIEGKINTVPTQFVFDTGAGLGVITSAFLAKEPPENKGNTIHVEDSNNQVSLASLVVLDSVTIGSFTFYKHQALVYDMPFLKCKDYFLLGADVINKLHWKFEFNNKKVYVSNQPFEAPLNAENIAFNIKQNVHYTDLYVNHKKIKNVLIDFGYNGFFEINKHHKEARSLVNTTNVDQMIKGSGTSMGVVSMERNESVYLKTKTISFSQKGIILDHYNINIEETDTKIGLGFFLKTCEVLVINPFEKKYSILFKSTINDTVPKYVSQSASILLENEKLVVTSKLDIKEVNLEIGEVVESIDGRKAIDFKDLCDYLDFMFSVKKEQSEVIKLNGEKVIITRVML